MARIGIGRAVNGYWVLVSGDAVVVERDGEEVAREEVVNLGQFVAKAGDLRLGWGDTGDFEIVFIYDRADGGFGYAVNLADPGLSEWGYGPFAVA